MPIDSEPHDVFISYARQDTDWVKAHLYEPLLKCRTVAGRPPRVFFDIGEHGVRIGQDFIQAIANSMQKAKKVILVYSRSYFQKKMCLFEFNLALKLHVQDESGIVLPILIDEQAKQAIPFAASLFNYWPISDRDWFEKLRQSLELRLSNEVLSLTFLDQPGDVFANHTLPQVRVAIRCDKAPITYEEEISIRLENGQLLGGASQKTQQGVASFHDLSIAEPVEETRLIASSSAMGEIASQPFSVHPRRKIREEPAADVSSVRGVAPLPRATIPATGEVVFFGTGQHLAVIQPQRILAYAVDGRSIMTEPLRLRAPIRIIRRRAGRMVFADWQGNVHLLRDDGHHQEWRFGETSSGFIVPADVDLTDDQIFVAFWSGSVFCLEDSGTVRSVLNDPAGVQALGLLGDRLLTCDFSGNLRVYKNGQLINTVQLDPTIWLMKETPTALIAVGEHKVFHVSRDGARVIDDRLPLGQIAAVYELSNLPIVIDADGKGIQFDSSLVFSSPFFTQPGATPVSADDAGHFGICRNPDGTRTLLVHDQTTFSHRIVFSHADGSLAVSPQGELFALGDRSTTRLYARKEFEELIRSSSFL
ncbi:MAG: toll/interleukin-1 receptor domain-containing protein [Planctomycetaceae bacterium]